MLPPSPQQYSDLKPQNLLVDAQRRVMKIADLGLGRSFSPPIKPLTHEVVTLWYRPPEVLLGTTHYNTAIDMWGVGCIFAEMAEMTTLLPGGNELHQLLVRVGRMCMCRRSVCVLRSPRSCTVQWCVNVPVTSTARLLTRDRSHRRPAMRASGCACRVRVWACYSLATQLSGAVGEAHARELCFRAQKRQKTLAHSAPPPAQHRYV